ncbi:MULTISPECIES: 3'-5' exonuclease [Halomonadaceae]|uniref:3'-5' exonuclease n=1 Tax=Halomonadaceae TaxID=28256 RepID=UPI00159B2583|nr:MULTISPECIES: 3'-5' exonuclease [Halomonas]QJQ94814.1 3'-5' exonuclease [Halomonas sp. PA5]
MLSRRHRSSDSPGWQEYYTQQARKAGDTRLREFYAAGSVAPQTPIADAPLIALDIETTGLDSRRHSIVSIGLVPFTLQRIHLSQRRYWVVCPPRPLSEQSITVHRLTHSDVADAPDLGEILDELFVSLSGRLAVVHFRHIERPFLDAAIKRRLGEGLKFPVIDTMSLEARRHRQSSWARLRRWLGRPPVSIRLHNSRLRYGLPPYAAHHALVDALATAELLQAQIARHYSPDTPVGELWS